PRAAGPDALAEAGAARATSSPSVADFGGFVPTEPRADPEAPPTNAAGQDSPPSTPSVAGSRERPADSPDVVIIAFSGHCGLVCHTRNTWSYLDSASEATGGVAVLDSVAGAYRNL